ncbi:TonB-dependent siderophore receptor [Horticoccus sp. 23ND18S-11]|uniref:TonB-dependent siderophore receptor n=1 Tax=Horticoccus sp. 23ND18S-11 TaxID=3391832 RepID=UPI0039C8F2F9
MKSPVPRCLLLCLAGTHLTLAPLAHGQTVAAPSPTASTPGLDAAETVKLSEFTVSTDRDRGYYSSNAAAGSVLADKPIKELALAISVVNRDLLDDLQTNTIGEALQFSASFSPESGMIRGQGAIDPSGQFTNRVGNSTNGVPDSGSVERIELVKGPPSVLMSSSSAGGSINIVPKRPQSKNFSEAEVQYGNFQQRYRIELNRVLTRKLSTRLGVQYARAAFNGNSLQGQTNIPEFDSDRRLLVFNSTVYKPFPNTVLGFDIEQVRDRSNQGNRTALRFATVTRNGQSVRLPWYLAYNLPLNWSISGPDVETAKDHRYLTAMWSQKWAAHFKTEANLYNQWYNEKLLAGHQNFEESAAPAGLPPFRSLRVSSFDRTQMAQRTTQIAFRGLFDATFRETKHQLVLKYNYYTFYTDSQSYRAYAPGTNPLTGLVAANETKGPWLQIEGASPNQLNGYDRGYPANLNYLWRYTQDAHDNPHRHQGNIIYTGEYPTRIGTFFPLAGISYHSQIESFRTTYTLANGALNNPTLPSRPHRWGSAPSAGIVYQVTPAIGLYSSYLESFQVPTNMNSFNELLPNREGVSHETGVKIELFDRMISGTFSYFDTTDKNRATTDAGAFNVNTRDTSGRGPRDPGFDANALAPNTSRGDTVALGEYNSHGWDFDLTVQPLRGLQATLSTTLTDAQTTKDQNPSVVGQRLGGFAKRNYGTVVSYRFMSGALRGLSVGGGYRFTSDRYLGRIRQSNTVVGSPFVDYWQPSAQSLLVFSKYVFKVRQRDAWVQFNADNLLKAKRYLNETSFTNLAIYGIDTPVVWRVTTGVRF